MSDDELIDDVDPTQPEPVPTAPPGGAVPVSEDGPQDDLPQEPGSVVTDPDGDPEADPDGGPDGGPDGELEGGEDE